MANFSESRIQSMINDLRDEFGPDIATHELAILELEDLARKGCVHESANKFDNCRDCPNAEKCPIIDWQKRHPEYVNDELATKIKILEAGGEEAYNAKLKAQEEAKKKAEEEAKDEASNIAFANDLKNDIIKAANCECTSHHFQDLLERYVQLRIRLAIRYGKIQI